MIGSRYIPGSGANAATDPSGCAGCGSIPGTGASGRLDPSMCACKHKGNKDRPAVNTAPPPPSAPPSPPSTSFIPPAPPQRKQDGKRPPVPLVTPPPSSSIPKSDGGGAAFIPPPPPPAKQGNGKGGTAKQGNLLTPPVILTAPPPPSLLPPPPPAKQTNIPGDSKQAPVPFVNTVPLGTVGMEPNPFAPYYGNGIDAASELCRAAGDAGLSDYCKQQLLAFLKSGSSMTLGQWIATNELCDQAGLRRAVGIAEATMAAKASAGLYDNPGFGNPFGVDGYAWSQDRMRSPNPYMEGNKFRGAPPVDQWSVGPRGTGYDGTQTEAPKNTPNYPWPVHFAQRPNVFMGMKDDSRAMAYRAPSGGMPNYYRPTGDAFSDALARVNAMDTAEVNATLGTDGSTDLSGESSLDRAAKGRLTAAQTADSFARGRDNPPTNYAAIIGSVGTAVGGILGGINQAVDQAENRRLRELEINYANNARGAQLALQTRQAELLGEISRLRAQPTATTDPATVALVQRLEQQGQQYQTTIQRLETESQGMSTGTTVALVAGGVAVAGGIAYLVLGNNRGRR